MISGFKLVSLTGSLVLALGTAHAFECENGGTRVKVKGEINNNDVLLDHPNGYGSYTSGLAELKLRGKNGPKEKLTCTLLGEPQAPGGPHQYHHLIVCDDSARSELHFKTGFDSFFGPKIFLEQNDYTESESGQSPVLSENQINDFCGPTSIIWFVETADVDSSKKRKGLFNGATGSLNVGGCVNLVGQNYEHTEINMGVSGKLCLPQW